MESGEWKMESGEWKMESGKWKVENGKWRVKNGEWKVENGKWKIDYIHSQPCENAPPLGGCLKTNFCHSERSEESIF
jgi:hypothetical protein